MPAKRKEQRKMDMREGKRETDRTGEHAGAAGLVWVARAGGRGWVLKARPEPSQGPVPAALQRDKR